MRRDPWWRALLILLVFIAGLHLAGLLWELATRFADIILLFFLAWLVAFSLNPVANSLMRLTRVGRPVAVALVYLALVYFLVVGAVALVPTIATQLYQLGQSLPGFVEQGPALVDGFEQWLGARGVRLSLQSLPLGDNLAQRAESIGTTLAQNALGLAQGVADTVFRLVLILILSIYMMLDGGRLSHQIIGLLPRRYQAEGFFFLESVGRTFGGFMRGVLLQAVLYGLGTGAVMAALDLRFVVVVSLFSAVITIVPIVGALLALVPPVAIVLFTGDPTRIVILLVALILLQQLVFNIVAPKLMSEAVGIHPLLVFLAMLVGAKGAGIWGAIFGVPVAGVLYAMASYFYDRGRRMGERQGATAPAQPGPDPALGTAVGRSASPPRG